MGCRAGVHGRAPLQGCTARQSRQGRQGCTAVHPCRDRETVVKKVGVSTPEGFNYALVQEVAKCVGKIVFQEGLVKIALGLSN